MNGPLRRTAKDWPEVMSKAIKAADAEDSVEAALAHLTGCAQALLGDRNAASRPGALKTGETDYRVSGVFLISPDREYNILVANHGFPAEQRRLSIPVTWNHPGRVVATERLLLLENTDEHDDFRQFLKTSKMGSSLYVPIFVDGVLIGQIVAAAQARWTYGPADIGPMTAFAAGAGLVWAAKEGAQWWASDYPAPDAWYADRKGPSQ